MSNTLYYHGDSEVSRLSGNAILCFVYNSSFRGAEGWSRKLSDYKVKGWEWMETKPYDGKAIGARCLIQW